MGEKPKVVKSEELESNHQNEKQVKHEGKAFILRVLFLSCFRDSSFVS
jgi:hypothetical protein